MICSCGPSKEEKEREAKRQADSIAAVNAANAAAEAAKAAAAAEAARQDSIRRDSITRVANFIAAIPSFAELEAAFGNNAEFASLFKSKGFTVTYGRGTDWDYEACEFIPVKTVIAKLKLDSEHYCSFKEFSGYDSGYGWNLTIIGAPEKLQEVASAAISDMNEKKRQYTADRFQEEAFAKQSGNTITYTYPMGGD